MNKSRKGPRFAIDRGNTLFLFLLAAVLYPAWGYIASLLVKEFQANLPGRFAISFLCVVGAGLASQKKFPFRYLYAYFHFVAYALTAHVFWLLYNSGMSGHYQGAALLIVCCLVATFTDLKAVLSYLMTVFAGSLCILIFSTQVPEAMGWLALVATAIVVLIPTFQVRERLIQDLRYSKASLDLFFDNASVGISHVDGMGAFQTVNPCFADFLGYSKEELESMTLAEVTPVEEREKRQKLFLTFIDSRQRSQTADRSYIRKDGSQVWLRLLMRRLDPEIHGVGGSIASAVDVTLERQHLRRHENFRIALLMIANGEETKAVMEHIGRSLQEDLTEIDSCEIYQQNDAEEALIYFFGRLTAKAETLNLWTESLMSRSNIGLGRLVVSISKNPSLEVEQISIIREYASLVSVALESKIRDKQIAKQQYQIISSEKMASLGVLAAGLAHEISNPTSVIESRSKQIVELLGDPKGNAARVAELCKIIARMSTRILKIVHGVRTLSRNAEGDGFQPSYLRSILDDTQTLCAEPIFDNGIDVEWAEFPDDLSLECRESQIAQVLLNLVKNSCEAIKDLDERWIKVAVQVQGNQLSISVTDSGKGIEPKVASHLFQPFFTTKEVGKGTGLGLSISADIARDHGGALRIDSTCEHTRFCLDLPLTQQSRLLAG